MMCTMKQWLLVPINYNVGLWSETLKNLKAEVFRVFKTMQKQLLQNIYFLSV